MRMFAFLRAINTGGRRLTNERLLEPFHAAGLDDVAAYQAAGNIAFRTPRTAREVEQALDERLSDAYGFDAPVFVRTADELTATLEGLPLAPDELAETEGRTQLTFMRSAPSPAQIAEATALVPTDDRVVFVDREWFWLPRAGVSGSDLPVARMERIVGPMTMRTVGTVERMLAKFGG